MPIPIPAQVVTALKDWGVTVAPYQPDGQPWYSHTTAGGWNPIGVMHHHTAGSSSLLTSGNAQAEMLKLLRNGRPGLPGPLCHLAPAMTPGQDTARVFLVGWGNVNHAGMGCGTVADRVGAGVYLGGKPGDDTRDGNPLFWGLEYMHPGGTAVWPDALLEQGHRAGAALAQVCGFTRPQRRQLEHREWTGRKIDRSWDGDVRTAVARIITAQKEANMDLDTIVTLGKGNAEVLGHPSVTVGDLLKTSAAQALSANRAIDMVRAELDALATDLTEIKIRLDTLATTGGGAVDVGLIAQKVAELIAARLEA